MMKHSGWKAVLVACLLVLPVIAGTSSVAWGSLEPPPEGYTLRGPALMANLTINGSYIILSNATCKGKLVAGNMGVAGFYQTTHGYDVSSITDAKMIDGVTFSGAAQDFPECWDSVSGVWGDLVVQAVSGFSNSNGSVSAYVVVLELLPQ